MENNGCVQNIKTKVGKWEYGPTWVYSFDRLAPKTVEGQH